MKNISRFQLILIRLAATAASFFYCQAHGGTVAGFGGSTEITQLLNNVQLVMSYSTQLQQYESQLKNLVQQKDLAMNNPSYYVRTLAGAVEGGEAIGLSSQRITQKLEKDYGSDYSKNVPYASSDFASWMKTTKDSIRGAMKGIGVQQDDLQSDADMVMNLKSMSASSQGNLQVAQTGNQIALSLIDQFQKMRTMQMTQSQAMNARMLAVQNKEEIDRAETGTFFGSESKPLRSFNN